MLTTIFIAGILFSDKNPNYENNEYSGDPNTGHSKNETIWVADQSLLYLNVCYSNFLVW